MALKVGQQWRWSISALALLAALVPSAVWADEVAIRAGARGEGARLVFDWPQLVEHSTRLQGKKLTLTFARPIESPVSSLKSRLPDWIAAADLSAGGRTLTLQLKQAASVQSFANGNKIVLDLQKDAPAPVQAAPAQTSPARPAPARPELARQQPRVTQPANKPEQASTAKPVDVVAPKPMEQAKPAAQTEPAVHTESAAHGETVTPALTGTAKPDVPALSSPASQAAPALPVSETHAPETHTPETHAPAVAAGKPVDHPADHPAATQPAEVKPADETHSSAVPAVTPSVPVPVPATPAAPVAQTSIIPKPAADDAPRPSAAPTVAPVSSAALPATSLPPLEMSVAADTPVAAFRRGNAYYVVVGDKNTPSALQALIGSGLNSTGRAQLVPAQGGRVIRIDLGKDEIEPVVETAPGLWRLRFDATQPMTLAPLEVVEEPAYALGPRVLVKTDLAATPVSFVDPLIGDTLIAVPVGGAGHAIARPNRFVQAQLLATQQGVAVKSWADDLSVITSPMGVELSAPSGFKLTELLASEQPQTLSPGGLRQGENPASAATAVPALPTQFDFSRLPKPAGADFTAQREELQNAINAADNGAKPAAWLNLARFYFVNGQATEAAAIWSVAAKLDPNLATRPEYAMIKGIAAFSSGSLDDAKTALAAVGQPTTDLALWRGMLAARTRDWVSAADQFRNAQDRLWDYPEPYATRLALAATETAINTQDYTQAQALLEKLGERQRAAKAETNPAVEYLTGVLDWNQERPDEARAHLGNAASGWNQYWRVRADLALIEADAKKPNADNADLLKRLERLRFAWRGDALEFDVLHRLAEMQIQAGNYAEAFEDFSALAQKFPNDPRTPGLADEQKATFIRIFQGDARDKTPAFVQLAIWDRYPEFRPTQPDVLNELRSYMAERVAGIDLLDRSATFYTEMLASTTTPEARATLGARIAGIRLLDHNPQDALKVIADTEPAAGSDRPQVLPDAIRDERRLLKARATFEQGSPQDALALLVNDYSEPAMRLRADITWRTKKWEDAAAVLDALIGDVPADGQLSDSKAGMLVSRATALALSGNKDALTELRTKFGPAMEKTPQAAAFQLITRPDVGAGLPDRNTLSGRMAEVDLFQQFLERYRQPSAPSADPAASAVADGTAARTIGPGATPQPAQEAAPH